MSVTSDLRVEGSATAFRLYDVGYEIDLERAAQLLGADERGRARPARSEARAFEIRQPPLSAVLGERQVSLEGRVLTGQLAARVFDFGVCSLRFTTVAPGRATWAEYAALGTALDSPELANFFEVELLALAGRLSGAITRPDIAPIMEDYVVFRLRTLYAGGTPVAASERLTDDDLAHLLLGEQRPLSAGARRDLLGSRFSYYTDDLAVITWDNALIVEPREEDVDVEYVLEFANAQLLELRVYDDQLDEELPTLYDRIAAARRRLLSGRFQKVLAQVQARVADVTEIIERADNALKVTDDVYLARIYEKALELFRERSWRSGIDRKLGIFRDTYAMLNDETQSMRSELLELTIVLLIVFEIVMGFAKS